MIEAPFAIAFAAGLVATLNPCGFAMLPAYIGYFIGTSDDEAPGRTAAVRRALVVGGVMSLAFLVVFGLTGLAITAGFRTVIDWIPWLALAVGVLVTVLGVALLLGREITVSLPRAGRAGDGRGLRSVFGFGLSYAVASLSCTLPVFLSVVATQLTASSLVSGVATFVVYGLGMAATLIGVTLAMALGREAVVRRLRRSARYIGRVSGAMLVVAGSYIVWFWGTNIGSGAEQLGDQGAFQFVETLSQRSTEIVGANPAGWALLLGGLITAAVAYAVSSGPDAHTGGKGADDGGPGSHTADPGPATVARGGRTRRVTARRVTAAVAVAAVGLSALTVVSPFDSGADGVAAPGAPLGPPVPTQPVTTFDGAQVSLADYGGRPTVVNFWASWCPSCVAELSAAIVPAQERFGDRVDFVGVNLQDEQDEALDLVADTGVQFDLVEDVDGELYREFGAIAMPFTAFISADGEVVADHNGALSESALTERITEVLAVGDDNEPTAEPVPGGSGVVIEDDPTLPDAIAHLPAAWATDFGRRTIDLDELTPGLQAADPRDLIPPLDDPTYESAGDAGDWLADREPGVLFEVDGDARFFPLRVLTFHEVVNTTVGGQPVVVTFCPLCNTAVVFDPRVDGETLRFGVSGLLRNSDLVMWDSQTESLWQQITGEGIVGELAGTQLELLGSSVVSWGEFADSFPAGRVLSRQTGFERDYGDNPYPGYSSSTRPFLFDGEVDDRFDALERVVGVTADGVDKAYPFSVLAETGAVNDLIDGTPVVVLWGGDTADALDTADITDGEAIGTGIALDPRVDGQRLVFDANGDDTFTDRQTGSTWNLVGRAVAGPLEGERLDPVVHRNDFWFAWAAFNPEAPVHTG
jgi:cytochrome c biogenesis protein CcdA/thiol-disulfide isomerase/thioredoxin